MEYDFIKLWMGDWVACTAAQQYRLRVQADVAKIQRHETIMCQRPLPTRFLRSSARYWTAVGRFV